MFNNSTSTLPITEERMTNLSKKLRDKDFCYSKLNNQEKKVFIDNMVNMVMQSKYYVLIKGRTLDPFTLMDFVKNYC